MSKYEEQKLIEQLPSDHRERNEWLIKNGVGEEVESLKVEKILQDTSTSLAEKTNHIMNLFRPKVVDCGPYQPMNQAPKQPRQQNSW